jgi:hypothetical protein
MELGSIKRVQHVPEFNAVAVEILHREMECYYNKWYYDLNTQLEVEVELDGMALIMRKLPMDLSRFCDHDVAMLNVFVSNVVMAGYKRDFYNSVENIMQNCVDTVTESALAISSGIGDARDDTNIGAVANAFEFTEEELDILDRELEKHLAEYDPISYESDSEFDDYDSELDDELYDSDLADYLCCPDVNMSEVDMVTEPDEQWVGCSEDTQLREMEKMVDMLVGF